MKYDPKKIEKKWQKFWQEEKTFVAKNDSKKEKKYILIEFPYPSGTGLHMGHLRPYIAGDIVSKFHKLNGKNTMYPIGWDAFGLPAENFAIKNKVNPEVSTKKNIKNAKRQLQSWGVGFDWSREINTTDPEYYKWTQKIFLEFFKAGLAYEATGLINWCPKDKTGLANEEVIDGRCERCGTVVEKKELRQWYLKITAYAEKLLEGLKDLPDWPDAVKIQQENWIGKSEGAEIDFYLDFKKNPEDNNRRGPDNKAAHLTVFTTRPDTIFGATYLVLAPEHLWVALATDNDHDVLENKIDVKKYIEQVKNKPEIERTNDEKEKTGIELKGVKAINPATGEEIPIFVADYVLGGYGTGAIMAVPAHDKRDFAFAKKYKLPIIDVIMPTLVDKINPHQPNKPLIERRVAHAIVFDPKNKKYLIIRNKKFGWDTVIIGGIEGNETPQEAALREIKEESGFVDLEFKRVLGEQTKASYYTKHKGENRVAYATAVYFELISDKRVEINKDEDPENEILWIDAKDFVPGKMVNSELPIWLERLQEQGSAYTGDGELIHSGKFSGQNTNDAKKKIAEFVGGRIVSKYKLRDWVFSRQRYWGEPIPVVHCERHGVVAVPDKDLPVKLPRVKNYEPTGTGESPLAAIKKWVETTCPTCEEEAKKPKYLIFDFDGVLGDTWNASIQTRINMGDSSTSEEAIKKMNEYFGAKPWHAKRDKLSEAEEKRHYDWSLQFGQEMIKLEFDLFDDFIKEIKKIKNTRIAVVSAGSHLYSKDKLKKSNLKYTHLLTMEYHHSKEEKIETIARAWKVDVKDVYYFTDAKSDVYELENLLDRKKIIGCAWGYCGEEKLREVLPENQVLKKFSDIQDLWKLRIARRETNTMPQWAGSSWYWLRYTDPKNKKDFAAIESQKYWTPVDMYFGGMEHTTLHLLYSRFWNQFLFDQKLVTAKEPFTRRIPHGIILGPDGEKMSKSRGNVVNPDDIVELYGADTMRLYMAFLGSHGQQVAWSDEGIIGTRRFIERTFNMKEMIRETEPKEVTIAIDKAIKKVTSDIEDISFNTAISAMMICANTIYEHKTITKNSFKKLLTILSPFAPHTAEELWKELGEKKSIFDAAWPELSNEQLEETISIAIQINGKTRAVLPFMKGTPEQALIDGAKQDKQITEKLAGKTILKVIAVKDRIVNFVVKD